MTKIPEDNDYDPQAEMVGRFIDLGWTSPDELGNKIKEAKEDERKRLGEIMQKHLEYELGGLISWCKALSEVEPE